MERNILKSNVYTNEIAYCETLEQNVDIDYSLPDYCPDILRILKCKAVPRISLKNISGKTITLDGTVSITVYYSDEDGKVNSFCQSYPFEKIKETEIELDDTVIDVGSKCEYINCRAITSRKIDIHGACGINICVKRKKECEIVSDVEDETVEVLKGSAPATSPTGYAEKYVIIEEETEISGDSKAERIFGYDADASIKETKIINGNVLVKGDMNVKIKYCLDDKIKCFTTELPFSQVLEVETLGDTCKSTANVFVSFIEITPKTDSSGYFNSCFINAKLLVCAETYCENDIAVVFDAYSRKKNTEVSKDTICFNKLYKNLNEIFNCKKEINIESDGITGVLDNWCDIKINENGFFDNSLFVNGTVTACFIIENSEGLASYFEKPIDFSYKCPVDESIENLKCNPKILVSSCSYTITSVDSIEVRVELNVIAPIYKCMNIPVVLDIKQSDENSNKKQDFAMIVYFASKDEKLWDIAKKYSASSKEIKSINDIKNDIFESDTTILIPIG